MYISPNVTNPNRIKREGMKERKISLKHRSLILLGLLMGQSQHGYQINEFIEKNLSVVTDMKKSTAYATLAHQVQVKVHF